MNNTLVFDIGKTNKKVLVFDADFQVIDEQQSVFDEIGDLDGEPTDDIVKIENWMHQTLKAYKKLDISKINFATYGATLAHLDAKGKLLTTPFNYLKKIDNAVKQAFLEENNGRLNFCTATASPDLEHLLNSGFQLYWLKKTRPEFFKKIHTTLHLPQYFSYLLTGQLASEYTSIGCHTMLWDFSKSDYHDWVKNDFQGILPKTLPINTLFEPLESKNARLNPKIGIGIHDSSAALIPYLIREKKPFLLLSTGTWSICLNLFNTEPLTAKAFEKDALFYMRSNGATVKATRLFLGKIHDEAVEELALKFHQKPDATREIRFNNEIYTEIVLRSEIPTAAGSAPKIDTNSRNLVEAYHVLIYNLIEIQVEKIQLAAGSVPYEKIIIDGGFAKNDLFLTMLKRALPHVTIEPSGMPQGTALGAALALLTTEDGFPPLNQLKI
jgi:sugar (pentulose or hexulose) kinase